MTNRDEMLKEMYSRRTLDVSAIQQFGENKAAAAIELSKPLLEEEKFADKKYVRFLEQKILEMGKQQRILTSNQKTLEMRIAKLHEKIKRDTK